MLNMAGDSSQVLAVHGRETAAVGHGSLVSVREAVCAGQSGGQAHHLPSVCKGERNGVRMEQRRRKIPE